MKALKAGQKIKKIFFGKVKKLSTFALPKRTKQNAELVKGKRKENSNCFLKLKEA